MNEDKNKETDTEVEEVSEEEKRSETEALAEVKDEELRTKVAEDLGIDPEDEPELLDKLVKREKSQREKLSGAIKQKISWRDKVGKTSEKPTDTPKDGEPPKDDKVTPLTEEQIDAKLDEREAQRDLKDLGLSEEIETEIKDLAKVKGISIREAAEHPYIKGVIEEAKKVERVKNATPSRKNKGSYSGEVDASKPLDPLNFALDTKQGRKDWNEAKKARRQYEEENK